VSVRAGTGRVGGRHLRHRQGVRSQEEGGRVVHRTAPGTGPRRSARGGG